MHGLQATGGTGPLTPYAPLLAAAAIVVVLDQTTKQVALSTLDDAPVHLIDGVLSLRLTFNAGGAFGLLQGLPGLFLVATIAILILILVWAGKVEDRRLMLPLGLVLGGGAGNLVDRLVRPYEGRVVDFVDLHFWPVFNVADASIVVGTAVILIAWAREGRREQEAGYEPESKPGAS